MADVNSQIRSAIDQFVQELNGLVRQAALEAVAGALGSGSATISQAPRRGRPPKVAQGLSVGVASKAAISGGRKPGAKRTPEELAELTEALYEYIAANPGQGIEAIGKGMQIETKELTLPVKKLIADGRISTEGQKRATKYTAGGPAPKAGGKGRGKRK